MNPFIRECPVCHKNTLVRFEWAHTALPDNQWYWRCALSDGCWAGPFVMEAVTMRPRMSWEEYFANIAKAVAARAACPRASVGAVLVSDDDHRILSTGYNGAPAGKPDCISHGCLMEDGHCQRALHAEVNAIAYAARHGIPVKGATLYLSGKDAPCRECMKVIIAAGVIWHEESLR